MKRHRIEQIYIYLLGVWWFKPRTEDPKSRLRFLIFMANVKFMVNYILNCSQIWQIRNFVLKNWTNITITFEFMVWYWGIVIKSLLWVEHVLQCSFNQNSSLLKIWRKEPKVTEPWNLSNRIEPSRSCRTITPLLATSLYIRLYIFYDHRVTVLIIDNSFIIPKSWLQTIKCVLLSLIIL